MHIFHLNLFQIFTQLYTLTTAVFLIRKIMKETFYKHCLKKHTGVHSVDYANQFIMHKAAHKL